MPGAEVSGSGAVQLRVAESLAPESVESRDDGRERAGRLLAWFDSFLPITERLNESKRRRARLMVGVAFCTAAISAVTAIDAGFMRHPDAAYVMAVAAAVMGSTPFWARLGLPVGRVALAVLAILFATVSYLTFAYGGVESSGALWLTIVPAIAATLSGRRAVVVTGVIVLLELCLFYGLSGARYAFPFSLSSAEHRWWALVSDIQITVFLSAFAVLSERDRARSQALVLNANSRLRQEMLGRQKAEEALRVRHRAEAVQQLTAGLAHQLNSPLQISGDNLQFVDDAVQGLLGVAEAALVDEPVRTQEALAAVDVPFVRKELPVALQRTAEGMRRISDIVRMMRELTESDGAPFEDTDVNELVRAAATIVRDAHVATVSVTMALPSLPRIRCRVREIHEAVLALLLNAAQAVERSKKTSPGRILVRSALGHREVVITIEDDGCGIPTEIRERIFDPFFTTRAAGAALGQGLTIARAIVEERHRGKVTFESTVGAGTTFTLRLPVDVDAMN
jgi:signal transduction histidine kinase